MLRVDYLWLLEQIEEIGGCVWVEELLRHLQLIAVIFQDDRNGLVPLSRTRCYISLVVVGYPLLNWQYSCGHQRLVRCPLLSNKNSLRRIDENVLQQSLLWNAPLGLEEKEHFLKFNLYEVIVGSIGVFKTFQMIENRSHGNQVLGCGVPQVGFRVLETLDLSLLHVVFVV